MPSIPLRFAESASGAISPIIARCGDQTRRHDCIAQINDWNTLIVVRPRTDSAIDDPQFPRGEFAARLKETRRLEQIAGRKFVRNPRFISCRRLAVDEGVRLLGRFQFSLRIRLLSGLSRRRFFCSFAF